ncbi:hypothetical protein J2T12_004799 [Paenibacillus anaericanus]|uniref:DUF3048 domain-containing protein n=1 Tax=Paenibacillus anaericanus TaxID=170367 RepID=UPI0027827919|nr:DUF3048 domain-containing protein [Paenibacillus anaericanus]MDQ0091362.1 hypothetical protein [Paenibacillus anaericanus]
MNFTKHAVPLILFLCLLVIPACGSPKEEVPDTSTPLATEDIQEELIPTPAKPAYIAPLTGLPLEEPVVRRPIAVMINNAPAARPQSGLGGADIVYEVLAEGGVTRLIAIYQGKEEVTRIGPIRSIRPYMIDLGESYHGVLVHAGASNDAYAILQRQHKDDLDEISNAGAYFWRDKTRKAPHNLYSNLEKLMEGAAKRNYAVEDTEVPSYTFREEDDPGQGNPTNKVEIKFLLDNYRVAYEYDPETKLYNRFVNGELHKDLDTGERITTTNVVIMGADHKVLDDVGRLSVDLELGGEALLFQHGKVIEGSWIRKSNDVIRFVKDNIEVPFYPGTTFFNIVPNSPDFSSHIEIQ